MYVVAAISRETTIAWDAVCSGCYKQGNNNCMGCCMYVVAAISRETTIAWDAVCM